MRPDLKKPNNVIIIFIIIIIIIESTLTLSYIPSLILLSIIIII